MDSPHFRDIYLNLMHGKVPLDKGATRRMENSVRDYTTLDGLLFKIVPCGRDDNETILCILTSKAHILMDMYHSSLIGGHTGITKCYQTICRRFSCPNLAEQLRAYITGCHTFQMFKKGKNFQRPYQKCINLNIPAMRHISIDIARSLFQQLCKVLFTQQLLCQVLISIYVRFSCLFLLRLCINIYCMTLGNVARVYPWIIQGLTFLSA